MAAQRASAAVLPSPSAQPDHVAEVDRYREHKVREGVLSVESINKTIMRLGQILAVAEERDRIARNQVRVNTATASSKTARKRPIYLDTAEQIASILDAATDLDARKEAAPPAGAGSWRR